MCDGNTRLFTYNKGERDQAAAVAAVTVSSLPFIHCEVGWRWVMRLVQFGPRGIRRRAVELG